jgi:hypothetical protein
MEYVISFKNTNLAIKAEQCLTARKQPVAVMPLPAEIRAGCGICLRLSDIAPAREALSEAGIDGIEIYSRTAGDNKFVYAKLD